MTFDLNVTIAKSYSSVLWLGLTELSLDHGPTEYTWKDKKNKQHKFTIKIEEIV